MIQSQANRQNVTKHLTPSIASHFLRRIDFVSRSVKTCPSHDGLSNNCLLRLLIISSSLNISQLQTITAVFSYSDLSRDLTFSYIFFLIFSRNFLKMMQKMFNIEGEWHNLSWSENKVDIVQGVEIEKIVFLLLFLHCRMNIGVLECWWN